MTTACRINWFKLYTVPSLLSEVATGPTVRSQWQSGQSGGSDSQESVTVRSQWQSGQSGVSDSQESVTVRTVKSQWLTERGSRKYCQLYTDRHHRTHSTCREAAVLVILLFHLQTGSGVGYFAVPLPHRQPCWFFCCSTSRLAAMLVILLLQLLLLLPLLIALI